MSLSLSELTATFKVFFQEEDNTRPDTHSLGGVCKVERRRKRAR